MCCDMSLSIYASCMCVCVFVDIQLNGRTYAQTVEINACDMTLQRFIILFYKGFVLLWAYGCERLCACNVDAIVNT